MTDFSKKICEKCGGTEIIQVEYPYDHPEHYDGISETVCMTCTVRIGRWSGKELGIEEYEKYPVRRKRPFKKKVNPDF